MNNQEETKWFRRNLKWILTFGLLFLFFVLFILTELGKISTDFVKAFADTELYENALDEVKNNTDVINLLGEIEPIDKMSILEGEVEYSNNNKTVNSTIRIVGTKGKARMDIIAEKISEEWIYSKINVRIKNPTEKRQTIEIISNK